MPVRPILVGIIVLVVSAVSGATGLPAPPEALAPAVDALRRRACGDTVDMLRQIAPDPSPLGARASYLLGHCLTSMGQYEESRQAFLDASQRHETLSAYARLGAARAALLAGDTAGAMELSRPSPGVSAIGDSAAAEARLLLARGHALIRAGHAREAVAIARRLAGGERPDAVLAEAWWLLGLAFESMGDRSAARSAFAMVWWGIPDNLHTREAAGKLRSLSSGRAPVATAQARAARGLRLVERWESRAAERELSLGVKGPLPEPLAAEAWYQLGVLRLGTRAGVSALEQAVRFPADRDRALFWLGVAWLRAGHGAETSAAWSRLRHEYPDSLWAARSIAAQGRVAEAAGRWQDADRLYALVIDRYPDSPRADEARWRRAWMRLQRGQTADARTLFIRYGTEAPDAPRASAHLYWAWRSGAGTSTAGTPAAGTSAAGTGRGSTTLLRDAAERYPLTFYGQRARARLRLPEAPRPPEIRPAGLAADRFQPAYEELAALGFAVEALEDVVAGMSDDAPAPIRQAAAELYARTGDTTKAIATVEPLIDAALSGRRPLEATFWRVGYPRTFWTLIVRESGRHGLDPLLVLAVIREESRFDPRAVSTANAVGLMQLLPSTARGALGGPVEQTALMDPAVNIRAGAAYLAGLLRRYQGTVPLAVAAYNAGPGGVRRHAALARSDLERFTEELPYAETRAYVQRVMQTYGIYRWLYR